MPHSHSLFSVGRPLQLYALLAEYALTPHAIPSASALTRCPLDIQTQRLVQENICTMHYSGSLQFTHSLPSVCLTSPSIPSVFALMTSSYSSPVQRHPLPSAHVYTLRQLSKKLCAGSKT